MADRFVDDSFFEVSEGQAQDEGDADGRVVDEVAVEALAVLAESFAVVGSEDEQGLVQDASTLEAFAQQAYERVGTVSSR